MIWSLFSLILFSTNVLSYFIIVVTTLLYNGVELLSYCCVKVSCYAYMSLLGFSILFFYIR